MKRQQKEDAEYFPVNRSLTLKLDRADDVEMRLRQHSSLLDAINSKLDIMAVELARLSSRSAGGREDTQFGFPEEQ